LAKYNTNGAHQWSKRFGDVGDDRGYAVAVDRSGNVFVTGFFSGTADFGGGNLVSAGSGDIFLAKYDANGVHQWSRRFGDSDDQVGTAIAVDGSGNVFMTGDFAGTVDFGGGNLVSAFDSYDIFLAKYNANGVHQWSHRFGGVGFSGGSAVAVDGSGNVVVTGAFENGVYFGGNASWVSAGQSDMFVARFSGVGVHQWSRGFGDTGRDNGRGVAVDGSGNVFVAGSSEGPADFGGGDIAGSGSFDIFVAKYGNPPIISQIVDNLHDQGGQVKMHFEGSAHDGAGVDPTVTQYQAYRRTDTPAGPGWVSVAEISATASGDYVMDAPTDADSACASGQHYSFFFIRAQTTLPGVFFDSPVDSGYSVDNLAPGVPANLTYLAGQLSWDASTAADFDHFSVYGSNTNAFSSATFVDNTVASGMNVASLPYSYYFVTATDHDCNEGNPANVGTLTGVGGTPASYVLSVSAYPNPFNPETTIRYTLPARGRVTIDVFDARGAHVARLVDAVAPAGAYTVTWNGHDNRGNAVGSGVYFARLTSAAGARSYKMTLLK
jgi:hypothetical protein